MIPFVNGRGDKFSMKYDCVTLDSKNINYNSYGTITF